MSKCVGKFDFLVVRVKSFEIFDVKYCRKCGRDKMCKKFGFSRAKFVKIWTFWSKIVQIFGFKVKIGRNVDFLVVWVKSFYIFEVKHCQKFGF